MTAIKPLTMRAPPSYFRLIRSGRLFAVTSPFVCRQYRTIQFSASPTIETQKVAGDALSEPISSSTDLADARFEVLGTPYSLLSVSLSASQPLYTRAGSLVAIVGKPENAQSTLSLFNPLKRAWVGVPFLYQRVSSTTPITALIATRTAHTTFTVIHLDGTTDWIVSQRPALLAWTGHTLTATPRLQLGLSFMHWGNTMLTGRGLAALSAPGQTYQVKLAEGEEFVAHPSHVVAYTTNKNLPSPVKLKGTWLRLQIPGTEWFTGLKWVSKARETVTYKYLAEVAFTLRTYARTWIFGDGLFLGFKGPMTLLMSSRGLRVADVLSPRQVNEIADSQAGAVPEAIGKATAIKEDSTSSVKLEDPKRDASHDEGKELKEFVR